MRRRCKVSVVVPTRNEGPNLPELRRKLNLALRGLSSEVIVVDDSTDAVTRPWLREIAGADPNWRVVERAPAQQTGLATAVATGIRLATGSVVCVMDGDLQHPPSTIPSLVAAVENGADIAVASRYASGGSAAGLGSTRRKWVSRSVSWVARSFFSEARRTTDPLSGFFCLRTEEAVGVELRPVGFKILLELLVCLPRAAVVDVPYSFAERYSGTSNATLHQGLLFGKHMLSLFLNVPLTALVGKIAIAAGTGIAVFALGLGLCQALGLGDPEPWVIASILSLAAGTFVYHLLTFRTALWRRGMAGHRLEWTLGLASIVGGVACFLLLMARAHQATVVLAILAQLAAIVIGYGLPRYSRTRSGSVPPDGEAADERGLQGLARRLGAEKAWWFDPRVAHLSTSSEPGPSPSVVRHVVVTRQPLLIVELPSHRPQARMNVDAYSLMLIPELASDQRVAKIAVLVRTSRDGFATRDLHTALAWLSGHPTPAPRPGSVLVPALGAAGNQP